MKPFVNFHAHSIGSMLDGNCKPKKYIQRAKEIEMPAVVFTDHGNMFTSMDAYNEANEAGVKYFFGQEFYQARKTRWDRDPEERASGSGANEWGQKGPYHLGIIAYNNVGYHNLAKLSSKAYLDGYYVKPRVDHELLAQHSEGLVCLSGCLSSEIQQALLRDDFDFAYKTACEFQEIFGRGNFFIEVQDHHIPEQQKTNPLLIDLAHKIGALVVPTCDCHYVYREDAADHDVLLCISTASNINDEGRFKFANDQFYLKSYEEMCELFPKEIVENTMAIYEKHDVKLDFGEYHFPVFEPPQDKDVTTFFEETVELGSRIRFGTDVPQEVKDRLDYEIKVIKDMGFPNYFMVITDIVNWAKKQGIMMGPGRGSVAGSLVAYCLKITEVNPLQFNLLFERFLVPGRISMPDVDIDIDDRYRDRVIDYARDKYGHEYTAKICNFSQIKAKNAVKDVARVLGYPYAKGDEISKAMPPDLFGKSKSLDECLETEQFRNLYETDPDVKIIVDKAKGIEGSYRQTGIHAAGLIMADKPVMEYVPVMREGETEPVKTQFDMHIIELCKLLKFDFLSLRNLNIIDICLKEIKRMRGKDLGSVWKLPLDDKPTYEALSKGLNVGAFQLESEGIRELTIRLKPSAFTDIMAILALYRPGPMGSNVHIKYAERKWGREPVTYLHPSLEPILNETYGLLLYQEQLIRIAQHVAGFSISEADDMRKVVGKKLADKMPLFREKFTQGCINTVGMNELIAGRLFDEIAHHADYSLSSNHACAYGMITYVTAYLKTHYPAEFMAATLSTVQDNKERLRMYLQACRSMNISVRPPSINKSLMDFSVLDNNEILYGLNAIRGLGDVAVKTLVECRSEPYGSIYDFL
jgi:DNA polymerase-3 subunit alpha